MKLPRHKVRGRGAFTLLELLVGVTTASAIFAIILTSGVAIYRGCAAASDSSEQENDQLRAIDYIARDLRNAISATTPGAGALSLSLPDSYAAYDDGGMPSSGPVDPVIVNGVPNYGDAAQPVAVNYFVSNGALVREQTVPSAGQTVRLVIAKGVSDLDLTMEPLSTVVKISITFLPRRHQGISALRPGATATATVAARMLRMK